MQNAKWKKGCIFIILLVFGASILPSIYADVSEKDNSWNRTLQMNHRTSDVSFEPALNSAIKQSPLQSLCFSNMIPIWKIGDNWIYILSIVFNLEDADYEISIDVSTHNLNFKVIDDRGDSYDLTINGDISGDFTFNVQGFPNIRGSLKNTAITGTGSIEQATLGIRELNLQIDGRLSLMGFLPIVIDIKLAILFNPSYHAISFPLDVGKEWYVNNSLVDILGDIDMPGISKLFPSIPDEIPINVSEYTTGGNKARCIGKESVDVTAGEYTAFNITYDGSTTVYFADAAGSFISLVPSFEDFNVFEWDFTFELASTTYVDPEAPLVPNTPTGPKKGNLNTEYTYSSFTTDPQGDRIYYLFDWDDSTDSGWLGPYTSSETCEATHSWRQKGSYSVTVKAKDDNGAESSWSDPFPISMPDSDICMHQYLGSLFQRFPHAFPLLRQFMGY